MLFQSWLSRGELWVGASWKRLQEFVLRTREEHARAFRIVEIVAAAAIILSALWIFVLISKEMAATSLWFDELRSIFRFTAKGPVTVATDYSIPANHIFFNLINSLTPGSASIVPCRARIWSFVAVASTLGAGLSFFVRRKQYLEGALFIQLLAANLIALNLLLQARGYGFITLAGVLSCLATVAYFERRAGWTFLAVSACTVLGTYTVPSYLFFAGPLLCILWISSRDARWFYAGLASVLVIGIIHIPVASQMFGWMNSYQEHWGREYSDFNAVGRTLQQYLIDWPNWALLLLLMGIFFPYAYLSRKKPENQAGRIILAASVFFFVVILKMQTPPVRTACFVTFSLTIAGLLAFTQLLPGLLRPTVSLLLAGVILFSNVRAIAAFRFQPFENWMGYADYVHKYYPPGTKVFTTAKSFQAAEGYLGPAYPVVNTFDPLLFDKQKMIIGVSSLLQNEKMAPAQIPAHSWSHHITQIRKFLIEIYGLIPPNHYIKNVSIANTVAPQCTDRDSGTSWNWPIKGRTSNVLPLEITPMPQRSYSRLKIVCKKGDLPVKCVVSVQRKGKMKRIPAHKVVEETDFLDIYLDPGEIKKIRVELQTSVENQPINVSEMWLTPQ